MTSVQDMTGMPEEMTYLSQKSSHLSAPGTLLNPLYYSALNSTIDSVESVSQIGRFQQALTSKNFNSSSQVQIPNGSFLGQTYLHLELPNLTTNQTLCRGWGIACIRQITFLFGSSSSSEISIDKQSILHHLLLQSEGDGKNSEMFRLAGEEILGPLVAPAGEDIPRITADILLPLPWSSINSMLQKKPYDTSLLMSPITVGVVFDSPESIYGGSDPTPNAFLKAELYIRQTDLTNKDLGLRAQLSRNSDLTYNYPFQFIQEYKTASFQGARRSSGTKNTLNLLSFINSDLSGIVLSLIEVSKLKSQGGDSPSPFDWAEPEDLELKLNGQTVFKSFNKSWKLSNLIGETGGSFFHNSVIRSGSTAPFLSDPKDSYGLFIDFSLLRPSYQPHMMQNTFRIPQQTMSVEFYTPKTTDYILHATYVYGSCTVSTTSSGETRLLLS